MVGRKSCVLTKDIRGVEYSREIQANPDTIRSSMKKAESILDLMSIWLRNGKSRKDEGNSDADLLANIIGIIEGE